MDSIQAQVADVSTVLPAVKLQAKSAREMPRPVVARVVQESDQDHDSWSRLRFLDADYTNSFLG
jgi:hypothetical protein